MSGTTDYPVTFREVGGKPEGAALADLAADAHVAAHELSEFLGNGETQPSAAVLASGGSIGLLEGLEEATHLFVSESDPGVADGKAN